MPTDITVITSNVSNITENSVTLNGIVTFNNNIVSEEGFEWKLSTDSTFTKTISSTVSNIFNIELNNLTPNSEYIYKAYVKIGDFIFYGNEITFTTNDIFIISPIVVTNTASMITKSAATISGAIIIGTETILQRGLQWKNTQSSDWNTINLSGISFSYKLNGLVGNTEYEFRAFVNTNSGTTYGITYSFNTLAIVITPPTVTTNPATMITQDSSTINGTIIVGTNPILSQGFELKRLTWSTWSIFNSTLVGDNISNNITGLVPNTTYEFRAYATTVEGKVYGTIQNFATLAIVPLTVTTSLPTEITSTSAILNGIITQGSEPIRDKGFYWRTSLNPDWIKVYVNETPYRITLKTLIPNTVYEFRAFASTATDVVYGEPLSFTTLKKEFKIYFGVADTIPTTKEEIVFQGVTTSLTFTTPEITKNINFIAFPEILTLVSVENNSFPGDFWYEGENDLYSDKTTVDIDGINYNVYCMTTFMPIAVGAKVILSKE